LAENSIVNTATAATTTTTTTRILNGAKYSAYENNGASNFTMSSEGNNNNTTTTAKSDNIVDNKNNDNDSYASITSGGGFTNAATNNNNNKNLDEITTTRNDKNNNNNSGDAAVSSKRVIIGGIPGVGKTSVICSAVKSLNKKGKNAKVVVFGTEMFEEAKRTAGIKNRDELRKLSVKDQSRLQDMTARRIAQMQDSIVIVDTHIFVRTGEGYYYPGLPMRLLEIIKPTNFVMIVADAAEIVDRRKKDKSRIRDDISTEQVQYEIDISKVMVATCSILTGAPFIIIANNDDKMDEAVLGLTKVLLSASG
jgi:adenylate kinase